IEWSLASHPLVAAKILKYYWFRLTDFAAPMAVALLATSIISFGLGQRRPWAYASLSAAILLCGWYVVDVRRPWLEAQLADESPVPPADAKVTAYSDWVNVCDWVAKNTPSDALFLTPRLNQSFKWRAGRAEVCNRKDMPQDAQSIVAWFARLKDIFYTTEGG